MVCLQLCKELDIGILEQNFIMVKRNFLISIGILSLKRRVNAFLISRKILIGLSPSYLSFKSQIKVLRSLEIY
jgi:hypothetical protein